MNAIILTIIIRILKKIIGEDISTQVLHELLVSTMIFFCFVFVYKTPLI